MTEKSLKCSYFSWILLFPAHRNGLMSRVYLYPSMRDDSILSIALKHNENKTFGD